MKTRISQIMKEATNKRENKAEEVSRYSILVFMKAFIDMIARQNGSLDSVS